MILPSSVVLILVFLDIKKPLVKEAYSNRIAPATGSDEIFYLSDAPKNHPLKKKANAHHGCSLQNHTSLPIYSFIPFPSALSCSHCPRSGV